MVAPTGQPPARPPALQEACSLSTTVWQGDLSALFRHAKDRFPDVVWDVVDEEAEDDENNDVEIWGHKGMCPAF